MEAMEEKRAAGDADEADPIQKAVESFMERRRRGEQPSIEEYVGQFPERGDEIRELFAALEMVEDVGDETTSGDGSSRAAAQTAPTPRSVGEYHILREIGRGGMGVVYEAVQASLGRHVALKVLALHPAMDARTLERFRREAQAAARLHHTNIVPVFGAGEEEGVHYYAMQFIQGQALSEVLKQIARLRASRSHAAFPRDPTESPAAAATAATLLRQPIAPAAEGGEGGPAAGDGRTAAGAASVQESPEGGGDVDSSWLVESTTTGRVSQYFRNVASVGLQVTSALAYAHSQGILHRDIKPSNLLLDAHGTVWVTDFGLAKAEGADDLTHTGDFLGTLSFMAPERFRGWSDPRSDIYSLGITLYQLATLKPAFTDVDRGRLVRKVMTEEPARPRRVEPTVPRDLETIILKAIDKEPSRRYQKADDFAEDLRAFLADKPIRARRASLPERCWRWCRRNRAASVLGTIAAIFLVVACASLFVAHWAERAGREALYWRYLSQARALGWSGKPGQAFSCLETLRKAAETLSRLDLAQDERKRRVCEIRNETIASETRADLRLLEDRDDLSTFGLASGAGKVPGPGGELEILDLDAGLERLAVSEPSGTIHIVRRRDRAVLATLPGRGFIARHAFFSPDETQLVAQYRHEDRFSVGVWDPMTGKLLLELPAETSERAVEFTPDSRGLAVGGVDGSLRVQEIATAKVVATLSGPGGPAPGRMRFRPDGGRIAVSFLTPPAAVEIRILDSRSGRPTAILRHSMLAASMAWHPQGALIATACQDANLYLWDAETGRQLSVLRGHEAEPMEVAFSHRGDILASRSWDTTVRLWDPYAPRLVVTDFCHSRLGPRFSPDDDRLLVVSDASRIFSWEVATGRGCWTLAGHLEGYKGPFWVDSSPDGRLLASLGYDGVRLWDIESGLETAYIPSRRMESECVFFAGADSLIVGGARGLLRWPLIRDRGDSGEILRVGPSALLPVAASNEGGRVFLGRDGRTLAIARGHRGSVVDLETGAETLLAEHHPGLDSIVLSPDSKLVATGTWGGRKVRIWDAKDGALLRDLPFENSAGVLFSPDGKWIVVSEAKRYSFIDAASWTVDHVIPRQNPGTLLGPMGFTEDGRIAAIVDSPTVVKLVIPDSGEELASLETATRRMVTCLAFAPDGSRLAAATSSHVIQLWDLPRVRSRLTELGIDWELPPLPPGSGLRGRGAPRASTAPGESQGKPGRK
jgi:serine/threonine protein kinase/WD40 repeat protein